MTNPADDIPQSEHRCIIAEERRLRTYYGHAQSAVDEDRGGRFAFSGSSTTVTGAGPIQYPAQPEQSPWHHDPIGTEPPLGIDINYVEAVGEPRARGEGSPPSSVSLREGGNDTAPSSSSALDGNVRRVRPKGVRRI